MTRAHHFRRTSGLAVAAVAFSLALLASCGGGGGIQGGTATISGASPGAISSGTITAFGSVFVNGHEFDTTSATVVDDDTNTSSTGTAGLEVGTVVDVKAASDSDEARPVAAELHVHPLARGYVDASSSSASTITVMGQTVELSSATVFSDHRSCTSAAVSPCTPITNQGGLTATSGSGASAMPGNYVVVHGFLFGSASGAANIEATLVSVHDAPGASASGAVFKVEGVVVAASGAQVTIGGLTVDLSAGTCYAEGSAKPCAGLFSAGQVVAAFSKAQPALPVTMLTADVARLRAKVVVETAGATVELEGKVASVTLSPASFVVRGITVDATSLPMGTTLPAVGDHVEVVGTVASTGQSIVATSLRIERKAANATYGFEGDAGSVGTGSAANTFTVMVLGQTVTVDANTRLADRSIGDWDKKDPGANPFNINTFQTYLAASTSKHLRVKAWADAAGNLTALGLVIMPASTDAAVAGVVDASPPPVNSATTGTPTTFSIHGVQVSADPAAIRKPTAMSGMGAATIAPGDWVVALGTYGGSTLTVTPTLSSNNGVIDFGAPREDDTEGF